jgi:hypothetical protein
MNFNRLYFLFFPLAITRDQSDCLSREKKFNEERTQKKRFNKQIWRHKFSRTDIEIRKIEITKKYGTNNYVDSIRMV